MMATAAIAALVITTVASAAPRAHSGAIVPEGEVLALNSSLDLLVLDQRGRIVRRLPSWRPPQGFGLYGMELSADRRHAYLSVDNGNDRLPARLFLVDLATGSKHRFADGLSPSLSPDRRRLLYLTNAFSPEDDYPLISAVAIADPGTHSRHLIPFASPRVKGTPPGLVTNWSTDNRHAVVFADPAFRLVDIDRALTVESQPLLEAPSAPLAPVFLDAHTIVGLVDCCIGRQHLSSIDLRTGARDLFAEISSPVAAIRRVNGQRVLIVTVLQELLLVSRSHVTRLARHIVVATI